ncbi:MAG: MtnX-like HAD-IB family phosphatase [Candidatus Omnitrophota bacterium]
MVRHHRNRQKQEKISGSVVFFDFDNTITTVDVIDDMLLNFSCNTKWQGLEQAWQEGRIGSRECLKGQISTLRVEKRKLDEYLKGIKIDPYFKKLIGLLSRCNIKRVILSDNFDYILRSILENNGISRMDFYANSLKLSQDKLIPRFPRKNKECGLCAHCKKKSILENTPLTGKVFYIGDGLSDICASRHADIVFAKEHLLRYARKKKMDYIAYRSMQDIYRYFKRNLIYTGNKG